jgi:stress-induced morphogen
MSLEPSALETFLKEKFPEAEVQVRDMTGTRDHYEIQVISERFQGKALLDRHREVHAALEGPMADEIHAVKLITRTP